MMKRVSIRITRDMCESARRVATGEHRSIAGQIEFWARVGRTALENPELPVSFVADALASLAEPRALASPFVPRDGKGK